MTLVAKIIRIPFYNHEITGFLDCGGRLWLRYDHVKAFLGRVAVNPVFLREWEELSLTNDVYSYQGDGYNSFSTFFMSAYDMPYLLKTFDRASCRRLRDKFFHASIEEQDHIMHIICGQYVRQEKLNSW